jgi:hypothetical protein
MRELGPERKRKGSHTGVLSLLGMASPPAAMWETKDQVTPRSVEAYRSICVVARLVGMELPARRTVSLGKEPRGEVRMWRKGW